MSDFYSKWYYGSNWATTSTSNTTTTSYLYGQDATVYLGNVALGSVAYWPEPAVPKKKKPAPETDMAWLERRVNEMCWVPA